VTSSTSVAASTSSSATAVTTTRLEGLDSQQLEIGDFVLERGHALCESMIRSAALPESQPRSDDH
jgi:hypothetical protein